MHHLKISAPNGSGASATIEVDGEPVPGLTSIRFKMDAASFATAELSIAPRALEFDGEADLELSYATRRLLVELGWTPPATEKPSWFLDCEDRCDDEADAGPYGLHSIDPKDGTTRPATGAEAMEWADGVVADGVFTEDHPVVVKVRELYALEHPEA